MIEEVVDLVNALGPGHRLDESGPPRAAATQQRPEEFAALARVFGDGLDHVGRPEDWVARLVRGFPEVLQVPLNVWAGLAQ
jgi:hypothetical protein